MSHKLNDDETRFIVRRIESGEHSKLHGIEGGMTHLRRLSGTRMAQGDFLDGLSGCGRMVHEKNLCFLWTSRLSPLFRCWRFWDNTIGSFREKRHLYALLSCLLSKNSKSSRLPPNPALTPLDFMISTTSRSLSIRLSSFSGMRGLTCIIQGFLT